MPIPIFVPASETVGKRVKAVARYVGEGYVQLFDDNTYTRFGEDGAECENKPSPVTLLRDEVPEEDTWGEWPGFSSTAEENQRRFVDIAEKLGHSSRLGTYDNQVLTGVHGAVPVVKIDRKEQPASMLWDLQEALMRNTVIYGFFPTDDDVWMFYPSWQ